MVGLSLTGARDGVFKTLTFFMLLHRSLLQGHQQLNLPGYGC